VAFKLCKKELGCLPVYAAYFVYLAATRLQTLEWIVERMHETIERMPLSLHGLS
jgi:hypothetical protein